MTSIFQQHTRKLKIKAVLGMAELVNRGVIKKFNKFDKTLQGLKKFSGGQGEIFNG